MSALNSCFARLSEKVVHVVDSCSAHVHQEVHENISTILRLRNMTCALQPVDAAIGFSFKTAFCLLLVNNVLKFVEKVITGLVPVFNSKKAVIIYDGVSLMASA